MKIIYFKKLNVSLRLQKQLAFSRTFDFFFQLHNCNMFFNAQSSKQSLTHSALEIKKGTLVQKALQTSMKGLKGSLLNISTNLTEY